MSAQPELPATVQYDDTAEQYEAWIVPQFQAPARILLEAANPRPGEAVVEVAAGTGGLARLLGPELGPAGRLVLTDLSGGMLEVARARFAKLDANLLPGVEIVRADLASLPFGDAEFDIVVGQFSPLQDSVPGLLEARRVLRLEGRLAIVYWGPAYAENLLLNEVRAKVGIDPYPRPDLEATEARVREAGFEGVTQRLIDLPLRFESGAAYLRYRDAFGRSQAIDPELFQRYREALAVEVHRRAPRGAPLELGWTVVVLTARAA